MSDRTKSERKPFFSIGDEVDRAAEDLARKKGIPTLTPPTGIDAASAHIVPGPSNDKPVRSGPLPSASSAPAEPLAAAAARPARASYVKVKCPDYLLDQLYARTRKERVTLNHVILRALREKGFRVDDADMVEDGRRLRGKALSEANGQM
jgi:hypothetical protein